MSASGLRSGRGSSHRLERERRVTVSGIRALVFQFRKHGAMLLQMNGATMLNLSLLTSDMWAVAVRALGFHESVDGLYFVAFALVAVGLLVYASGGEPLALLPRISKLIRWTNHPSTRSFEPLYHS